MKIARLSGVVVFVVMMVGCRINPGYDSGLEVSPEISPDQAGWYQIYFSAPDSPSASTLRGGPDAHLANAIFEARLSVDMAMDSFNLWSLRDALLDAHRRGVSVRVVMESEGTDSEEVQQLIDAGIEVVDDRSSGLMHNKFAIIDRREIWTGSMNLTVSGAYRSDNNLLSIQSTQLAENYLVEFEEMFIDYQFGADSPANTPWPVLDIKDTRLEVYFSPDDGTMERVLELIRVADESVYFMAYSLTDDDLAMAMIAARNRGVEVAGVMDEVQALNNQGGEYQNLLEAGVDVRLDGNPNSMHHKVIIIDNEIMVTGSYNFSKSARTRNDENTLILYNRDIVELYLEEFERVWRQSRE